MANNNEQPQNSESGNNTSVHEVMQNFRDMSDKRKIAVIGIAIGVVVISIYIIFFSGDSSTKKQEVVEESKKEIEQKNIVPAPQTTIDIYKKKQHEDDDSLSKDITLLKPPAPPVLEVPKMKPPELVAPPPVQKEIETPPLPLQTMTKNEVTTPAISTTSVIAFGGVSSEPKKGDNVVGRHDNKMDFQGFDGGTIDGSELAHSDAQMVVATKINSNLHHSIVQGKIIEGVLETAINTSLITGIVRAIVSHDVYAEHGDIVLIPKGARMVGKYNATTAQSGSGIITRINTVWTRVVMPSGVDINLPEAPGNQATDPLGRNGIPGYVDTNITNAFTNAFLVSVLGPYIVAKASGIDKEVVVKRTPTPTPDDKNKKADDTITVSSMGAQIIGDGMSKFQGVATEQLNKYFPPGLSTIFVDQGTRINIMVQHDITFPKKAIAFNTMELP